MAPHKKPTPQEMEAKAQAALSELDELDPSSEEDVKLKEVPDEPETVVPKVEEVKEPEKEPEKPKEEDDEPEKEPDEDIRKKLRASTQEALILHSSNKKIQEAITKAAEMAPPTDEVMTELYPEFDDLDDFSKKMARENYMNTQKMQAVTSVSQEFKDSDTWRTKVDEFVDDPANVTKIPDLDGREEEFRSFAMKPTRRGVEFEDLVASFLYNIPKPVKSKGKQLERVSGPAIEKPENNGKIGAEAAATLRKTDYKAFTEMLRSGKIDPAL